MDRAGADASRLLQRKFREFSMIRDLPADASGAYWPGSQANNRIFPREITFSGHMSLNGYVMAS